MTEKELDAELHTIIGAVMHNNMVASSEACGRIRDAFYKQRVDAARQLNAFQAYFITNGDEATFQKLKGLSHVPK